MLRRSLYDPAHQTIRRVALAAFVVGGTIWSHACVSGEANMYGPYSVIGYNYTDRHIAGFYVNGHGVGSSEAHQPGGGGGIFCCLGIPKHTKILHIKVKLGLTKEQYERDLPNDTFETDIPVPQLPNKHDGYIEFHFLPDQRVEVVWVNFPTTPNIPNAH
jgi:hypothetical protein